jgi:hypothetical protein
VQTTQTVAAADTIISMLLSAIDLVPFQMAGTGGPGRRGWGMGADDSRDRGSWEDKSLANFDEPRYRPISVSMNWITSVALMRQRMSRKSPPRT